MKSLSIVFLVLLMLSVSSCTYFHETGVRQVELSRNNSLISNHSFSHGNNSSPNMSNYSTSLSKNFTHDFTSEFHSDNVSNSSTPKKSDVSFRNTLPASIKLLPPNSNQIYFGAFPDFGGSEDNVSASRIKEFENLANKKILWAYFSQNWFNGIKYPKEAIHTISNQGVIPFVRLMPRSDEEQFHKEDKFSMQNIIDGKFDEELRKWARDAKADFKDTNTPLLIDFAVEMNGDWFPWSGYYLGGGRKYGYGNPIYPDGPERYRDAYRHIIDIFKEENVTHVTWFFHADINSEPDEEWNQPNYYYPGDDYIDWIGFSIYGPQNPDEDYWDTFDEILKKRYESILDISSNKPIAILEFGVTDNHPLGNKGEWLTNAFETILDNPYINLSAVSYWHENWEEEDNLFATLRIDSSKESLEIFRKLAANNRFVSKAVFEEFDDDVLAKNETESTKKTPKLLFKSGFEEGVYLDEELVEDFEDYVILRGSDVEGFNWPITILGANNSGLHFIGDDNKKAVTANIESKLGHTGKYTNVLVQNENYEYKDYTQCPYEILDIKNGTSDLYIKYWIKLDSESITKKDNNIWRTFFEYKTKDYAAGDGFRLISFIYTDENGIPYWHWQGDKNPETPIWEIDNKKVPVPLDEWFLTEFYWHWSEGAAGRALWKVNGKTIGDYHGPTTRNSKPIDFIMLSQIYGNSNPKKQFIDDIEIWDAMPINQTEKENVTEQTQVWYKPMPGITWQWQLSGEKLNTDYDVDLYDIDLEDTPKETIENLQKRGIKVICYFNAGAYEPYRSDSNEFPKEVLGKTMEGWEDEKWLDISHYEKFAGIMEARLDLAVEKNCDGVEPDNIHAYQENNGFSLTFEDQLRYNEWLADQAHTRGLAIALKNDGEQVNDLVDYFDFAVVEECFQYNECEPFKTFVEHNKAVLGVEYELSPNEFCQQANNMNFSWLKMNLDLDGSRISCN